MLDGLRAEGVELPLGPSSEGSPGSVTATSMMVVAQGTAVMSTHTVVHSAGVTVDEPLSADVSELHFALLSDI